jgi:hypothetical protein
MQHPPGGTEHFSPGVVMMVMGDVNAPMQVATVGSQQHTEYVDRSTAVELKQWLNDVRQQVPNLPDDQRDDATAQIETAEAQLKANRPSRSVLQTTVGSLLDLLRGGVKIGVAAETQQMIRHLIEHPPQF